MIKEITVEYKGVDFRIKDGIVYVQQFGTTILNHSQHWSWIDIDVDDLKEEVQEFLKQYM